MIEACDASLAIEYPTVMEDSLDIYDEEDRSTESRIEDLRKNLRVFKIQGIYIIDTESLRKIKNRFKNYKTERKKSNRRDTQWRQESRLTGKTV